MFIVGVCPIYPNKKHKQFLCTFWTQLYSITYLLCITGIFLYSGYNWVTTDAYLTKCRAICLFTQMCQTLCATLLIIAVFWTGIMKGHKLTKLYNDFGNIDNALDIIVDDKKLLFVQFYLELILILAVLFSLNIFAVFWLGIGPTIYANIFYITAAWFMVIEKVMSFQIRMLTKLVLKRIIACVTQLDVNSFNIIDRLHLVIDFYEWKNVLNDCFGVQLLFIEVLDFIVLTMNIFNTMYICVYVIGRWSVKLSFSLWVYIFPTLIKTILMKMLMGDYGEQVFEIFY